MEHQISNRDLKHQSYFLQYFFSFPYLFILANFPSTIYPHTIMKVCTRICLNQSSSVDPYRVVIHTQKVPGIHFFFCSKGHIDAAIWIYLQSFCKSTILTLLYMNLFAVVLFNCVHINLDFHDCCYRSNFFLTEALMPICFSTKPQYSRDVNTSVVKSRKLMC